MTSKHQADMLFSQPKSARGAGWYASESYPFVQNKQQKKKQREADLGHTTRRYDLEVCGSHDGS